MKWQAPQHQPVIRCNNVASNVPDIVPVPRQAATELGPGADKAKDRGSARQRPKRVANLTKKKE